MNNPWQRNSPRTAGRPILLVGLGVLIMALTACGGGGGGSPSTGDGNNGGGNGSGDGNGTTPAPQRTAETFFAQRVAQPLQFCRTCHYPGGLGDVPDGRDFSIRRNTTTDQQFADFKASWQRLGGNNPVSRILTMASGQETPHDGGVVWPPSSTNYRNVSTLLQCFEHPDDCADIIAAQGRRAAKHSGTPCSSPNGTDTVVRVQGHDQQGDVPVVIAGQGGFTLLIDSDKVCNAGAMSLVVTGDNVQALGKALTLTAEHVQRACETSEPLSLECQVSLDNDLMCDQSDWPGIALTEHLWGNSTPLGWAASDVGDSCHDDSHPLPWILRL